MFSFDRNLLHTAFIIEVSPSPICFGRLCNVRMGGLLLLSDGRSLDGGKENLLPPATPPPIKRRCTGPPRGCVGEIREATTPILKRISRTEQKVASL